MPWQCGLQASPIPEELEEVIAISVCDTSRQHRGQGAGGGGWGLGVSFPEPNPAEVLTAHPRPLAPTPRNHASLEVLNTALYTKVPNCGPPRPTGELQGASAGPVRPPGGFRAHLLAAHSCCELQEV